MFSEFGRHHEQLLAKPRKTRRRAQRTWKMPLAGHALAMALGVPTAYGATIVVGAGCGLGQAIIAANEDMASAGCTAGNGPDTLVLPVNGVFAATETAYYYSDTAFPTTASNITVEGNGSTIHRSENAAEDFRLFKNTGDLTLKNLTLSGGKLPGADGGAIFNTGSLTLIDSVVSGNTARTGAAIATTGGLLLESTQIRNNLALAEDDGAALSTGETGSIAVRHSSVSGNSGGGVDLCQGPLTVERSDLSNNTTFAVLSGEIAEDCPYQVDGAIEINQSTISGNAHGLKSLYGDLTVSNSTISGNADWGIENVYGNLNVTSSTITGNGRGVYDFLYNENSDSSVTQSIISGNIGREIIGVNIASAYNLIGDASKTRFEALYYPSWFFPDPTDILATSDGDRPTPLAAILDARLANNGGSTLTHALIAGSPAIDAFSAATGCPPEDQRAYIRPVDGDGNGIAQCDLGAVEFNRLPIVDVVVPVRARLKDNLVDGNTASFWSNDGNLSTAYFEVSIAGAAPIGAVQLATRPNRSYRLNIYVDGVNVGQFVTESRSDTSLQRLPLPPGTAGTTVRIESARNKYFSVHEVALSELSSPPLTAAIVDAEVPVKANLKDHLFDGDLTTLWRNDGDPASAHFELILSDVFEISQFSLAPRPNRDYRFNLFVDNQFVGEYTTDSRPTVELQKFDLPEGMMGSRLKFELLNRWKFIVYEAEVVVAQ